MSQINKFFYLAIIFCFTHISLCLCPFNISNIGKARFLEEKGNTFLKVFAYNSELNIASFHQTTDGGYITSGSMKRIARNNINMLVSKLDGKGNLVFAFSSESPVNENLLDIKVTRSENLILLGKYDNKTILVSLNQTASIIWSKILGFSYYANSIDENNNGFFIAGSVNDNLFIAKLNKTGDIIWCKVFKGSNMSNQFKSLKTVQDEGVVSTGFAYSYGVGLCDIPIIKFDSNGVKIWSKILGGSKIDEANSIKETKDKNLILGGWSSSFGNYEYKNILISKLDPSGNLLWAIIIKSENTKLDCVLNSFDEIDEDIIFTGNCNFLKQTGDDNYDIIIGKFNTSSMSLSWMKRIGESGIDSGLSIEKTFDGGFAVFGKWNGINSNSSSFCNSVLIKLDSNGNFINSEMFDLKDITSIFSVEDITLKITINNLYAEEYDISPIEMNNSTINFVDVKKVALINFIQSDFIIYNQKLVPEKTANFFVGTFETISPYAATDYIYEFKSENNGNDNNYFYIKENKLFTTTKGLNYNEKQEYKIRIISKNNFSSKEKSFTINSTEMEQQNEINSDALSDGELAGIIVGGVVGFFCLFLICVLIIKRKKYSQSNSC